MDSHLTDEQLEILLDGEGKAYEVAHVRSCEACRTRLAMIAAREHFYPSAEASTIVANA